MRRSSSVRARASLVAFGAGLLFAVACGSSGDDPGGDAGAADTGASSSSSGAGSSSSSGAGSSASSASSASSSSSSSSGASSSGAGPLADASAPKDGGVTAPGFVFGAYKDTGIAMNWNTNVVSTSVSGAMAPLATDLTQGGAGAITLAFATGECGAETWAGVPGDTMASVNVPLLERAGVKYIISTGGAAGSFTCGSDAGMTTFLGRWASAGLVGVDFDIEAGQTKAVIDALVARIGAAHAASPGLRFSLTLATLANNDGSSTATPLGAGEADSFNAYGDMTLSAVQASLGFSSGTPSTWPSYLTVNLMTMDYGAATAGVCVVSGGACQMGQSALQAAYNLHDRWGVPFAGIELTPMIGGNDDTSEHFTLADVDTVAAFAKAEGLAGVHYWSYDRDVDCAVGSASSTCNSMGNGYAGARGYLERWLADGLR